MGWGGVLPDPESAARDGSAVVSGDWRFHSFHRFALGGKTRRRFGGVKESSVAFGGGGAMGEGGGASGHVVFGWLFSLLVATPPFCHRFIPAQVFFLSFYGPH